MSDSGWKRRIVYCGPLTTILLLSLVSVAQARTWTSAGGGFSVDADLVEVRANGTLVLRRADGQMFEVALAKLSAADQQFVRGLPKKEAEPAAPVKQPPVAPAPQARPVPPPPKSAPDGKRLPVPNDDVVAAKVKETRALLADDYREARGKPEARQQLGEKLMKLAKESVASDPMAAYALATEAASIAAEANDLEDALSHVDWVAEQFAVPSALARKVEIARSAKIDSLSASDAGRVYATLAALLDEAENRADTSTAEEVARIALRAARKSGDASLVAAIRARGKLLKDHAPLFTASAKAIKTLQANPDDREASVALGKFQCFVRGDWDEGLPRLAAGSDAALAALARQELAHPADANGQLALADAWWTLSEEGDYRSLPEVKRRGGHWYRQSLDKLAGLDKLRAEKRIAEIPSDERPPAVASSGGKAPAAKNKRPVPLRPGEQIYLTDLRPSRGEGYSVGPIAGEAGRGSYARSLRGTMKGGKTATLTYEVNGQYLMIEGVVFNEPTVSLLGPSACVFEVVVDGRKVWRSPPMADVGFPRADFRLLLAHAKVVQLVVYNPGPREAFPVWGSVQLTKAIPVQ